MLSVVMAFLAVGAIIIIGFISNLLFNKSKIPDVLILIALGYLIGPGTLGVIDSDMFDIIQMMAPLLAAVALAMIMFDGGLGLNYDQVLGSLTKTMLHTIVAFALSIMITTGIFWLRILAKLQGQPFSYMVTIAVLFIMYALTDILVGQGGVGAIAALIFGLVLGNKEEFARIFKKFKGEYHFNEEIRQFHCEISFFVRTFFFVYLGIVFSMTPINNSYIVLALGIFLGLVGVRFIAASVTGSVFKLTRSNRMAVFYMMPRGLSAAVLASYPLALGVVSTDVGNAFLTVTLVIIILTTIMASIGSFTIENAAPTPEQLKRMNLISRSRYAARWLDEKERNDKAAKDRSDSEIIDLEK